MISFRIPLFISVTLYSSHISGNAINTSTQVTILQWHSFKIYTISRNSSYNFSSMLTKTIFQSTLLKGYSFAKLKALFIYSIIIKMENSLIKLLLFTLIVKG